LRKIKYSLFVFFLCASPFCSSGWPATDSLPQVSYKKVCIIEPLVIYENAYNEQRLPVNDSKVDALFHSEGVETATNSLKSANLLAAIKSNLPADQQSFFDNLKNGSEDLVKEWKDKTGFQKDFESIGSANQADAALVQFVKVKVGSDGTWDFMFTGAMTPGTSTTVVKSALIDLKTGKTLWSGASIERSMPTKFTVQKLYKSLYADFPNRQKENK
jgi:hypothetical protein